MWRELRVALYSLRKARGFTAAGLLVIGLCVGANTAIFSIVHGVLWRPLNFTAPERLVSITERLEKGAARAHTFSAPEYLFLEQHAQSFAGMAVYTTMDWELSGIDRPDRVTGLRASASLFRVLGVPPQLGRTFTSEEDEQGRRVAVLSDSTWRRTFGGRADAIGRTIYLDRQPYTVIGAMPRGFAFPLRHAGANGKPADVFVPISWSAFERSGFGYMYNKSVIARLKPGVTEAEAAAEVNVVLKRFEPQYPAGFRSDPSFGLSGSMEPYQDEVTGGLARALLLLAGAIGLVLLIGCANLANLLLARSVERRREFAVRAALGAKKFDLIRQNLIESSALGVAGGALGLALAAWLTPLLVRMSPVEIPRLEEIHIDGAALLFTLAVCCLSPLLFGLVPAIESLRIEIADALREAGRSGTRSVRQRRWMAGSVIAQYALTVILLVASGLLMRSFLRLRQVDPGFQTEHILSMGMKLPNASYKTAPEILTFYDNLIRNIEALPGVEKAGAISDLPLSPSDEWGLAVEGKAATGGTPRSILLSWVSGDAMQALNMKLVRGRLIGARDTARSARVVVVNQTMAREAWSNEDPIGKRIGLGGKPDSDAGWVTVAGVVADVRQGLSNVNTRPQVFQAQAQASGGVLANTIGSGLRRMHLIVRSNTDPASLTATIRRMIAREDPALPVTEIETLDQYVNASVNAQRYDTYLIGCFASFALVLAMVGIGGVLWYNVAQRTNELGVRLALGGTRVDLMRLVVKDGLRLATFGIVLGFCGALAICRLLSGLLYQTSSFDSTIFLLVPVALAATTLVASLWPAWRATRVDPMIALRVQ